MELDTLVHQLTRLRIFAHPSANGEMASRDWLDHYTN
jgi:hypothetical protein